MVRATTVLRREGRDVGRLVRGIRSMGDRERISAAFGNDCSRGLGASWLRLPRPEQHRLFLRRAVVHLHQRQSEPGQPLWRLEILANKVSRRLQKTHRVQHARLACCWKSVTEFSANPETSN